jgi:hypothetical protein
VPPTFRDGSSNVAVSSVRPCLAHRRGALRLWVMWFREITAGGSARPSEPTMHMEGWRCLGNGFVTRICSHFEADGLWLLWQAHCSLCAAHRVTALQASGYKPIRLSKDGL